MERTFDSKLLEKLEPEGCTLLMNDLLNRTNFFTFIEKLGRGITCTNDDGQWPNIWIRLDRWIGRVDKNLDYSNVNKTLTAYLHSQAHKFKRLHFNHYDSGDVTLLDEFIPVLSFVSFEVDLELVKEDLYKLAHMLDQFQVVEPRELNIVLKEEATQ